MKFNVMAFVVRDQFGAGTETLEDRRKEVKRKRGVGEFSGSADLEPFLLFASRTSSKYLYASTFNSVLQRSLHDI